MHKHLHIVTHDVPWPVVHGGMYDLFYKIVSLHKAGVSIHLHCFRNTKRKEETELEKYCVSVNYYIRTTGLAGASINRPYIVNSRDSKDLLNNLLKDEHPILLEGIHCTAILQNNLGERKVLVRLHNIEYKYYLQLAKHEGNIFKKMYYLLESRLLKKYEASIARKAVFLAVSEDDAKQYREEFAAVVQYVPVFLPYREINTLPGKGCFCLYHGNLSVNENEKAVSWLIHKVFNKLDIPLVIAGKDPSPGLKKVAESKSSTCLVINPSEEQMQDMISKAQVNILPSFNNTGVKLKLLNALFNGRHCLVNQAAVAGSGLEKLCTLAESHLTFREKIQMLYGLPVTEEQIALRKTILEKNYDSERNAARLMTLIW